MGNSAICACGQGPPTPVKQKLVADTGQLEKSFDSWDFLALDLDQEQLGLACIVILQAFFSGCGGTCQDALPGFICGVREGYLPNPYHNFAHAVDVLQTVLRLGTLMPWEVLFSPSARLGLLVAALAHDIGHPGVGNVFLVDAGHEVAHRYNDVSPLENMHCSRLFEVLAQGQCDVFAHLPRKEFSGLRKLMIDAILHTDAVHHSAVLEDLRALIAELWVEGSSVEGSSFSMSQLELLNTADRRFLLARVLLLGADQSNQAKPWRSAFAWAELCREELVAQGDRERAMGFAVPPLHDRCATSLPEAQLYNLQLIAAPLLAAEVRLFPRWAPLAANMAANVEQWGVRLAKENFDDERTEPDERVQALSKLLGPVRTLGDGAKIGSRKNSVYTSNAGMSHVSVLDEVLPPEPCSEPSCPEAPSAPLVREIRRWRENQIVPGQQRELVLLYIVSDEGPGQRGFAGQPILYRYMVQPPCSLASMPVGNGGGSAPSESAAGRSSQGAAGTVAPTGAKAPGGPGATLHPAASAPPVAPGTAVGPSGGGTGSTGVGSLGSGSGAGRPSVGTYSGPLHAQAWSDSSCSQLDSAKFDTLLGSALEDLPEILHRERAQQLGVSPQTSDPKPFRRLSLQGMTEMTRQVSQARQNA